MNVDQQLIDTAFQLLHQSFSQDLGRACAAYSGQGRIFTGILRKSALASVEPEMEVISETGKAGELVAALVTLSRTHKGSAAVVRVPPPMLLEQLQNQARRHAQIAVSGSVGETIVVRPLWELVLDLGLQSISDEGHFAGGMKAISYELIALAKDPGVKRTREGFSNVLVDALSRHEIRNNAAAPALPGSKFRRPTQLESVSLRHIWLGFEFACEKFTFDVIDSVRLTLADLGCNNADVVHIKQGVEALQNIFATLLVLTGTRTQVLDECPFYPYDWFQLQHGLPIHRYIKFEELAGGVEDTAARNAVLVRQLIDVLTRRQEGGFTGYLAQRELFNLDIFDGRGAGHCPFSRMAQEIIYGTAVGLEQALNNEILVLAPDGPRA